jgi:hypothetical protein
MTRTVAARPIRAIIIQPDKAYEVRKNSQDIQTFQGLVGGYPGAFSTDHCVLWWNHEGKQQELPLNQLATYLWWNLVPEMDGRDALQGPVFVTGLTDDIGDSTPVPDDVIDYFKRIDGAARKDEGQGE